LYALSLLRAGGFDEATAISCLVSLNTFIAGVLTGQAIIQRPRRRRKQRASRLRNVPSEIRRIQTVAQQMTVRDWMEHGVDTMLLGIRARHAALRPEALELRAGTRARA
jgi:hypothetical protein